MFFKNFLKVLPFIFALSLQAEEKPLVCLTQIVEHPSLDKIREGVIDELKDQGFSDQKTIQILYRSAQGNVTIASQIASQFASMDPAVIVALATPSAQTVIQATRRKNIPVVFGAVTDPVGAKIVPALFGKKGNLTGTVDRLDTVEQVALILRFQPNAKSIGILYNPSEANAVMQMKEIIRSAEEAGLKVKTVAVTKGSEVSSAAQSIVNEVNAFLIGNDNLIVSALEVFLRVADSKGIPLYTSDPDSVKRGAAAAVANDQYQLGRETGKLVARVLKGEKAQAIPLQLIQASSVYLNEEALDKYGLLKKLS